ncbi:G-type lectin S-receptor-like serine/threonine-protein kinase At1g11300 [Impatiens glandulifera]|uniref:G-type lectin S-receptor-like serine/threonine-protein kinase At1g11300 n=1 Tax=Impatiens glandulifera TaxID=253017 RepID=UPI001FB1654B|nr:G-type lectin S-receptor-like serine/threonine-protein kinase At1g11300 [Impatiens glandulifera]
MGLSLWREIIQILQVTVIFTSCFCLKSFVAENTIDLNNPVTDPGNITSKNGVFRLGFFSLSNNNNFRYVGIWYNVPKLTVVWVANKDKPLNDSSGLLTISKDGNLVVLNGKKDVLWSSNVSYKASAINTSALLQDSGNLILQDASSGKAIWQSFEHVSNSFLVGMRLSVNMNSNKDEIKSTSWRSNEDPSFGVFTMGMDPYNLPQVVVWNGSLPYWRSGPWNGQFFIGKQSRGSYHGLDVTDDKQGNVFMGFTYSDVSLKYFLLDSDGVLKYRHWVEGKQDWEDLWLAQETECDFYGRCGLFAMCNPKNLQLCSCLKGFEPNESAEWNSGNFTSGCKRLKPLECQRNSSQVQEVGKRDGFLKLGTVKIPDFSVWSSGLEDECQSQCLNNCSCTAYAYYEGIGCMQWDGGLIDLQQFSNNGADFYFRVAHSELGGDKKKQKNVVIAITVTVSTVVVAIAACLFWFWVTKRSGKYGTNNSGLIRHPFKNWPLFSDYSKDMSENSMTKKVEELPLFDFEQLLIATNHFHLANKLGEGGFGPVYKGKLQDGQLIAVKRLSSCSSQGLEEFMNEVMVISKLQHRNLVKLLGCCIEREEKMLVYELMPNKGLDAFLFDSPKQELLDWRKRANIIEGVGRGLLYLHRDSRLKIIHRDLKASNILLDEELNPKISDFGMARIFGGNEDQARTMRVVGTYGYMSPEYAMHGRFSEKSDVFSYGMLLLEIVSGRRNSSFYNSEQSISLIGYTWKLWNSGDIAELIDPKMSKEGFEMEILRCIHVGLLCVQDSAKDRPPISTALSMLSSEIDHLPQPNKPAFAEAHVVQEGNDGCSANQFTITMVEAR